MVRQSIKNLFLTWHTIASLLQKSESFFITTPLKNNNYVTSSSKILYVHRQKQKIKLDALSNKQSIIYDGSEYKALNTLLPSQNPISDGKSFVTFITGTEESTGDRYVGILLNDIDESNVISIDSKTKLLAENAARIPKNISDKDALCTAMASLIHIHCALPRIVNVGGEDDSASSFVSGKVVVLGGGEYAAFAARGLAAIGVDVTLVSTNSIKIPGVKVLPPAVGEMEIGFSSVVGEFDSLLDTLYSEADGVKYELNRLHKCSRYVSTYNKAQDIIRDSGIFFGPNAVKSYQNSLFSLDPNSFHQPTTIPYQFGSYTLQKLLDQNILFKEKKNYNQNNNVMIRSWSLKDFWEFANWPRDSDGGLESRFGLPVLTEIDLFGENEENQEENDDIPTLNVGTPALDVGTSTKETNPFVTQLQDIEQLQQDILSPKRNCLLFLTAPNCKTCFRLKPAYTRMARQNDESVLYATADVVSTRSGGKELGKLLGIQVVPSFVLFRDGDRFGPLINVSKLPNKKLDKAIQLLVEGRDWDANELKELERE